MSHTFTKTDESFMRMALEEARRAAEDEDVPVGAVLVQNGTGEILARGRNTREVMQTALGHAEMNAISAACAALGSWRLEDCTLYVTLEPCPMCAGAILNAHIPKVYFGAYDFKNGVCGTVTNLFEMPFGFKPRHEGGIMQEECADILKRFFKKLR